MGVGDVCTLGSGVASEISYAHTSSASLDPLSFLFDCVVQ